MSESNDQAPRRMVPRWRLLAESRVEADARPSDESGEVDHHAGDASVSIPHLDPSEFLHKLASDFERSRSLAFAGDLVGAALVAARPADGAAAAEFILDPRNGASPQARLVASALVGAKSEPQAERLETLSEASEVLYGRIASLRRLLRTFPDNPVGWADLSRHFAILGQSQQARRAMTVAVNLAPDHRLVLRAASRLFVHTGDNDFALRILRRSPLSRTDPWVMAAEIATSEVAEVGSKAALVGSRLLRSNHFSPSQGTELAAALGALELSSGGRKRSRDFFRRALTSPTENVVAQAEWSARTMGLEVESDEHLKLPQSFEARALASLRLSRWEDASQQAQLWLADEPFSIRPAVLASFVGSVLVRNWSGAIASARLGLRANPRSSLLRNNLAFALASNDQPAIALQVLGPADGLDPSDGEDIAWLATTGLIHFRSGRPDEGKRRYEEALSLALEKGDFVRLAQASLFLGRELTLARDETAPALFARAELAAAKVTRPYFREMFEQVKRTITEDLRSRFADAKAPSSPSAR